MSEKHSFFLVVPPGFESAAEKELLIKINPESSLFQDFSLTRKIIPGGIEFEADLEEGLQLNILSKIATRLLLRVAHFRCRDFPKLYQRLQKIDWLCLQKKISSSIDQHHQRTVFVSCKKSRLMNKKRLISTAEEALEKSLGASYKKGPDIFLRIDNDNLMVSLNVSGGSLFKRGYKLMSAQAPIRENLAAACFWTLYDFAKRPSEYWLCDPLCGTGTLLLEALAFNSSSRPSCLIGFDQSVQALEIAKKNFSQLNEFFLPDYRLKSENLYLEVRSDLLSEPELKIKGEPIRKVKSATTSLLGLVNPPYGERLSWGMPPALFYKKLMQLFYSNPFEAWALIVPQKTLHHLPAPHDKVRFSNGGINVSLMIYRAS